jgi:hypothetical protein
MTINDRPETLVEKRVTYSLELNGKFLLVENVPARVNEETEEQFFSPSIVAYLQQIMIDRKQADRTIKTPVYIYAG